jgi:hypothetical protein
MKKQFAVRAADVSKTKSAVSSPTFPRSLCQHAGGALVPRHAGSAFRRTSATLFNLPSSIGRAADY